MRVDHIENAFEAAARDFNALLEDMRPYRSESEGYCEANLIGYFAIALRGYGYRPFLELPIPDGGRVDALFVRDSTLILVEAKQFHRGTVNAVDSDLMRLAGFDLFSTLRNFGFARSHDKVFHVALCDCWSLEESSLWTQEPSHYAFLKGFHRMSQAVTKGHLARKYFWLLAYKQLLPPVPLSRVNTTTH